MLFCSNNDFFSLARSLRSLERTEIAEKFFLAAVERDGSQKPPQASGRGCAIAPSLFFMAALPEGPDRGGITGNEKIVFSLRSLRAL
jgi:hypothetical protein